MINVKDVLSQESAAALGLFDGVHLGHQRVLSAAVQCRKDGLISSAFTFDTETFPKKHGKAFEFLYTEEHKRRLFEAMGIEAVYTGRFSDMAEMDGESFCRDILKGKLKAKRVFCGSDFRFGRNAAWGFKELEKFGERFGFEVHCVEPVCAGGAEVSSSRVREYLSAGKPEKAEELLGRPYEISGEAVHGKALGRTMKFPTVNQIFKKGQLVPAKGVYLSKTETPEGTYFSVTNIGVKPTVSDRNIPLSETHLLDFEGDLYGKYCVTKLLRFIRPEKKFESITALQRQISKDTETARRLAESI